MSIWYCSATEKLYLIMRKRVEFYDFVPIYYVSNNEDESFFIDETTLRYNFEYIGEL